MQHDTYQPIMQTEPRVRIRAAACLPVRSPLSDCRRCAETCPVDALEVNGDGPRLIADCIGCGQCAAQCPSSALKVEGFPALPLASSQSPVVRRIDCWRVPRQVGDHETLRVPCTGGLNDAELITLNRLAGAEGIAVIDRGWCEDCKACNDTTHPAQTAVDSARRILDEAGIQPRSLPRIAHHELPLTVAEPAIPDAREQRATSRRDFLRRLGGEALTLRQTLNAEGQTPSCSPLVEKIPSPRLDRLQAELNAETGRTWTPAMLARITVNDHCQGHGICAALCPTGALALEHDDTTRTLRLDATRCIACGLCERACPEQAIRVLSVEGGAPEVSLKQLSHQSCRECGSAFTSSRSDQTLCRECRKSQQLAAAGFGMFFQQ